MTQNGFGLHDVWRIWKKLRQNADELLNDGDKLMDILEKMCPMKLRF
jgi:hypothetical protein